MIAVLKTIPHQLSARTFDELRALMLANNFKNSKQYLYQDIQFAEGKWNAFYFDEVSDQDKILSSQFLLKGSK